MIAVPMLIHIWATQKLRNEGMYFSCVSLPCSLLSYVISGFVVCDSPCKDSCEISERIYRFMEKLFPDRKGERRLGHAKWISCNQSRTRPQV
jgi:hypothetical protein